MSRASRRGHRPLTANGQVNADLRGGDATRADTAFRFASEGPANAFWWVDGPFRCAITALADRAALTPVSTEMYRQPTAAQP